MKDKKSTLILILTFFAGLSLMLYPTVSNWYNSTHQGRVIVDYTQQVDQLRQEEHDRLLCEAEAYNAALSERSSFTALSGEENAVYRAMLLPAENSAMAYVEIPAIGCTLPIRHGTEESVLDRSVGHLEWSSLPVGGAGTHCVISGHRGLPSSELFTNLDRLEVGSTFKIHVLGETLDYRVDHIATVEPLDYSLLGIEEGKDYVTLVTCTPYGINSHRLLVRGVRAEPAGSLSGSAQIAVTNEAEMIKLTYLVPVTLLVLAGAIFVLLLADSGRPVRKKGGRRLEEKQARRRKVF